MRNKMNDRTIIFTSHRYANLYLADRIIVLNNGRIVETGTKEELMDNKAELKMLAKMILRLSCRKTILKPPFQLLVGTSL